MIPSFLKWGLINILIRNQIKKAAQEQESAPLLQSLTRMNKGMCRQETRAYCMHQKPSVVFIEGLHGKDSKKQ